MSNYPVNLLKSVLAKNGDKTIPPLTAAQAGIGRFSQEEGWRVINSTPDADGGIAPKREDFNGIANLLSQFIVWYQQGGIMKWNSQLTYEVGNEIIHNGTKYRCKQENTNIPPPNRTYWKNMDSTTPIGAIVPFGNVTSIVNKHPVFVGDLTPDDSWVLCDGTNGTPNLVGKYIQGANSTTLQVIGSNSKVISVDNLPSHSHGVGSDGKTEGAGGHDHGRGSINITGHIAMARQGGAVKWSAGGALSYGGSHNVAIKIGANDDWGNEIVLNAASGWSGRSEWINNHQHTVSIGNTGGGQALDITPASVTIPYFMKVAE